MTDGMCILKLGSRVQQRGARGPSVRRCGTEVAVGQTRGRSVSLGLQSAGPHVAHSSLLLFVSVTTAGPGRVGLLLCCCPAKSDQPSQGREACPHTATRSPAVTRAVTRAECAPSIRAGAELTPEQHETHSVVRYCISSCSSQLLQILSSARCIRLSTTVFDKRAIDNELENEQHFCVQAVPSFTGQGIPVSRSTLSALCTSVTHTRHQSTSKGTTLH